MDDSILKINLSHLGYSQWEFGIPRKGLTWKSGGVGLVGGCLSGVFQGFSDSSWEFRWDELV